MNALLAAALVVVASAAAALAQPPRTLEGAWTAVAAERDGKPADDVKGHRLTFAGNTFVIQRDGTTLYRGTYRTEPGRTPAQIDFTHSEGALKGKRWLGIYALEADTLRIADNAPDMTKPRPAQLAAKAGSGHVLVRFTRASP